MPGDAGERHEGLNLEPPAGGFELYRHENTGEDVGLVRAVLGQAQRGRRLRDPGRDRGGRGVLGAGWGFP
jgi:hypothetical protein